MPIHYGPEYKKSIEKIAIHCPTKEFVSERTSERSGAREQSRLCRASKRVSSQSERRSEWPSTYVSIHGSSELLCSANGMEGELFFGDDLREEMMTDFSGDDGFW